MRITPEKKGIVDSSIKIELSKMETSPRMKIGLLQIWENSRGPRIYDNFEARFWA